MAINFGKKGSMKTNETFHKEGTPKQEHKAITGAKSPIQANIKNKLAKRNYTAPKGRMGGEAKKDVYLA